MAFLQLCDGDPVVTVLWNVFRSTVVRIPEARIQPFTVVLRRNGHLTFQGNFRYLLANPLEQDQPKLEPSPMADLSGKETRSVGIGLGLKLLDGLLRGFQIPASGIMAKFDGALEVSFRLGHVERIFIDRLALGQLLRDRKIDLTNPASSMFLEKDSQLLLIDSIITSRSFSVNVTRSSHGDFDLDVPAIQALISTAGLKVAVRSQTTRDVEFDGPTPLTFAFSCVQVPIAREGAILRIDLDTPQSQVLGFGRESAEHLAPAALSPVPGALDWDNEQ